jgi:hypothetical protein
LFLYDLCLAVYQGLDKAATLFSTFSIKIIPSNPLQPTYSHDSMHIAA